jgi:hypothetical protein
MTKHKAYYNQAGQLSSYEATEDGGLLIHDVIIMAAGSWTDMHGIDTTFTEEVLQRCAGQWADNAVWTRHSGGTPRSVTEKIGAVVNPYYSHDNGAVMGDVYLHCQTDASKACASLVQMPREAGGIKDVSAETVVEIQPDGLVIDVSFTGLALVEDGACEVCKLPAFGKEEPTMADDDKMEVVEEVIDKVEDKVEEEPKTEPEAEKVDDLVDILGRFVEALIPEAEDMIKAVNEAEGEERVRALGRLEGCMSAWGVPCVAEEYSKHLDDKFAEFSKAISEKLDAMQSTVAQYGAPTGLKGKMGADKDARTEPQVYEFSRQGTGIRTALY